MEACCKAEENARNYVIQLPFRVCALGYRRLGLNFITRPCNSCCSHANWACSRLASSDSTTANPFASTSTPKSLSSPASTPGGGGRVDGSVTRAILRESNGSQSTSLDFVACCACNTVCLWCCGADPLSRTRECRSQTFSSSFSSFSSFVSPAIPLRRLYGCCTLTTDCSLKAPVKSGLT